MSGEDSISDTLMTEVNDIGVGGVNQQQPSHQSLPAVPQSNTLQVQAASKLEAAQRSSFEDDSTSESVQAPSGNMRSQSATHYLISQLNKMDTSIHNFSEPGGGKSKREALKVQKKVYRIEKKRAAKEILSTLRDPSVVLMADYLKVRGMLRSWTKFWCVLKPGVLILYKSQKQKSGHWVGTIVLNSAKLIERPSKKDGFCFKIYHPLDQSIWAQKGPKGETYGALTQPLMYSSAIFRAPSEAAGKNWMDALELALRCSSLLMRSNPVETVSWVDNAELTDSSDTPNNDRNSSYQPIAEELNESDREDHFKDLKESGTRTEGDVTEVCSESETTSNSDTDDERNSDEFLDKPPNETTYTENKPDIESSNRGPLQEEFADENKNIIWCLMKQVRPGMDLSKVTLPTFILEPRSLLEKFADYYYHCDILSRAAKCDEALTRMKEVVRWYVSGFYKTPKGVKKPYNPILGEKFRCYWKNEETNSRTFYIAEQLSHHPPVSAFYVTNRQDGFSINCAVLAKSKFYGNSVSAVMDGVGKLNFLKLGEEYSITIPYGYAKGIIIGSMTMELGGKVAIECDKTGYKTELEFKLKPFMGSSDSSNKIHGKIKLGNETLCVIDGRWDQEIYIKEKSTGKEEVLWKVDNETVSNRLKRYTVPMEAQSEFESERLWQHVSEALGSADQEKATQEKYILEEAQRTAAKERKVTNIQYNPQLFERDSLTGDWIYKYSDLRPWDPVNDIKQYEQEFKVLTHTKHNTPLVRQMSIVNVNGGEAGQGTRSKPRQVRQLRGRAAKVSESSTPSHMSDTEATTVEKSMSPPQQTDHQGLGSSVDTALPSESTQINAAILRRSQQENQERLRNLQSIVVQMAANQQQGIFLQPRDWLILALVLFLQTFLQCILLRNSE